LEAGAHPDALDADGNFALYLAVHLRCAREALACAAHLLRHGADPNQRRRGRTALNFAVEREQPQMVRMLLDHGAFPLRRVADGAAPKGAAPQLGLTVAAFAHAHGFADAARAALQARLTEAVASGDAVAIDGILDGGCPANVRDSQGRTPLIRAVQERAPLAVVTALLQGGAAADARDTSGTHVLAVPIIRNDAPLVRALLKYRADPLAKEDGVRMDVFAQRNSTNKEVQRLLARCATHASGDGASAPSGAAAVRLPRDVQAGLPTETRPTGAARRLLAARAECCGKVPLPANGSRPLLSLDASDVDVGEFDL